MRCLTALNALVRMARDQCSARPSWGFPAVRRGRPARPCGKGGHPKKSSGRAVGFRIATRIGRGGPDTARQSVHMIQTSYCKAVTRWCRGRGAT
jgi:hypothetical protein